MTEDDLEWSKERIREGLLATKLGVGIPWSNSDYDRLLALWTDKNRNVTEEYRSLYAQINKELFNERGH